VKGNGVVRENDIDRTLSGEDAIVPSSGFAASVMGAVQREASIPPPIPFPWKRALPGLVFCAGVLLAFFIERLKSAPAQAHSSTLAHAAAGWIAAALLVSLASVLVPMRVCRIIVRS
jgi:hypothetical protein